MKLRILAILGAVLFSVSQIFPMEGVVCETDPRPLDIVFHRVCMDYWDFSMSCRNEPEKGWDRTGSAGEKYSSSVRELADRIISDLENGTDSLDRFGQLLSEINEHEIRAYGPVIKILDQYAVLNRIREAKIPVMSGSRDDDYIYRLGRELRRELVKVEWVIFRKTIMKNVTVSMVVEADVAKLLKVLYPVLFLLDLGSWLINGEAYFCYKTTFTTQHKLFFRTVAKMGQNKVWFEVLRAKKTWWGSPKWECIGETFKVIEEPTGEELADEMKVLD